MDVRIKARVKARVRASIRNAIHHFRIRVQLRALSRKHPVLVYQMGKVGSSTVVKTLNNLNLKRPVLHVHTLNADVLREAIRKERRIRPHLPEHLITSKLLVKKLTRGVFPCTIITLTREPVSRALSFVFEDWQKKASGAKRPDGTLEPSFMKAAVTEMLISENGHSDPTRWFDREVREVFGIDVFSAPYDVEKGYSLIERGLISVVVIRMEDIDRALPKALHAAMGVDPQQVSIDRTNVGQESWYNSTYRGVLKSFRLPANTLDSILSTRYIQHFYRRERENLRRRWAA